MPATHKRSLPAKNTPISAQKRAQIEQGVAQAVVYTGSVGSSDAGVPSEVRHPAERHAGDDIDGNSDNEESREALLTDDVDEDKKEYDEKVVKASVTAAFSRVEKEFRVIVPHSDRQTARQLIPKVSTFINLHLSRAETNYS